MPDGPGSMVGTALSFVPGGALLSSWLASLASWLDSASGPTLEIPAFMGMDGAYVAEQRNELSECYGWLRLEGHGTAAIRRTEAHIHTTNADWAVLDPDTVRIVPQPGHEAEFRFGPLLLTEGEEVGCVLMRPEDPSAACACNMRFVPEEDEDGPGLQHPGWGGPESR